MLPKKEQACSGQRVGALPKTPTSQVTKPPKRRFILQNKWDIRFPEAAYQEAEAKYSSSCLLLKHFKTSTVT